MDGEQGRSETMVVERKVPRREEEEEEDERGRLVGRRPRVFFTNRRAPALFVRDLITLHS